MCVFLANLVDVNWQDLAFLSIVCVCVCMHMFLSFDYYWYMCVFSWQAC